MVPIIIGINLGLILEKNVGRSLLLSRDEPIIFVERPINAVILTVVALMLCCIVYSLLRSGRRDTAS